VIKPLEEQGLLVLVVQVIRGQEMITKAQSCPNNVCWWKKRHRTKCSSVYMHLMTTKFIHKFVVLVPIDLLQFWKYLAGF